MSFDFDAAVNAPFRMQPASHWAPERKVGRSFAEVHAPVADNRLIAGAASHLARLVTSSERWERFVWTIARHPRLHAHPDRVDPAPWPDHVEGDALAATAWWRTERQSFIPVEGMQQAVFAIHDYRGLAAVRDRQLRWLAKRSAR